MSVAEIALEPTSVLKWIFGGEEPFNMEELVDVLQQCLSQADKWLVGVIVIMKQVGGNYNGKEIYRVIIRGMDASEAPDPAEVLWLLNQYADMLAQIGLQSELQISFTNP